MMTSEKATKIVVDMALARSEETLEGEALRLILRELKDQRKVGLAMERAIHDLVKRLEDVEESRIQPELLPGGTG